MRCDAFFGAECMDARRCKKGGCVLYRLDEPKDRQMGKCHLVNALGVIIAQFYAGESELGRLAMVEYRGKNYARRFEQGGGEPAFHEVRPDMVLRDQDVAKKF